MDGNGIFDSYEYITVSIPSSTSQQFVVLNFAGLPPFFSSTGYSFLRLRITDVALTAADATGAFGKGEVEDYLVLAQSVLPVSLENFTALPQGEDVLINWTVSEEMNVKNYQVEHSTDNVKFSKLNTIPATSHHYYSLLHTSPANGSNYYRLNIINADGSFIYSPVRRVNFDKNSSVDVYPNPAKNIINIRLNGTLVNESASVCLFSFDGRLLKQQNINVDGQPEAMDVSRFQAGFYFIKIYFRDMILVRKIEVTKHK